MQHHQGAVDRAIRRGIPITTTLRGLQAAIQGLQAVRRLKVMEVCTLQEFNRRTGPVARQKKTKK